MSTKIVDICALTIHVPLLADDMSLWRQFEGQTCGNDEDLKKAYKLFTSYKPNDPLHIKMVLVETEPLLGSPAQEIISSACKALDLDPSSLAKPSLAQCGALASLFREEAVKRVIPLTRQQETHCLVWERAAWPTRSQPVFRLHKDEPIHGEVWAMLPLCVQK